jgi:hypothetical protein
MQQRDSNPRPIQIRLRRGFTTKDTIVLKPLIAPPRVYLVWRFGRMWLNLWVHQSRCKAPVQQW